MYDVCTSDIYVDAQFQSIGEDSETLLASILVHVFIAV